MQPHCWSHKAFSVKQPHVSINCLRSWSWHCSCISWECCGPKTHQRERFLLLSFLNKIWIINLRKKTGPCWPAVRIPWLLEYLSLVNNGLQPNKGSQATPLLCSHVEADVISSALFYTPLRVTAECPPPAHAAALHPSLCPACKALCAWSSRKRCLPGQHLNRPIKTQLNQHSWNSQPYCIKWHSFSEYQVSVFW